MRAMCRLVWLKTNSLDEVQEVPPPLNEPSLGAESLHLPSKEDPSSSRTLVRPYNLPTQNPKPPVEPPVELLVNPSVETATLELVVANGCIVQPRLSFEGGFTRVVNEGTPGFEFLSNAYNEAQEHMDYQVS